MRAILHHLFPSGFRLVAQVESPETSSVSSCITLLSLTSVFLSHCTFTLKSLIHFLRLVSGLNPTIRMIFFTDAPRSLCGGPPPVCEAANNYPVNGVEPTNNRREGLVKNYPLEDLNAELVNLIALFIGLLMTVSGFLFTGWSKNTEIILVSTGTSVVASSIVVWISSKYLIRENKIGDIIGRWGLTGIYRTRSEMNRKADLTFENLKYELDIIAFGLKSFRHSKGHEIRGKSEERSTHQDTYHESKLSYCFTKGKEMKMKLMGK